MSIKLNSSGGGSVVLQEPVTASTLTLNLPAFSGTAATLASVTNNGVLFVNGSGQPTSGSALTFNGTNLTLGTAGALLNLARLTDGSLTGSVGSRTGSEFSLYNGGGSSSEVIVAGNSVNFNVGAAEQMRLTSTGLGIGTSSPSVPFEVQTASGSSYTVNLVGRSSDNASTVNFWNSGKSARNFIYSDPTTGMQFGTSGSERARIDSSGNLLVGPSGGPVFQANGIAASHKKGQWTQHDTAQPYGYVDYYYGAFRAGYILWNSGGLSLNSLSDVRMKQNIQDADSSLSMLNSLQVRQFDWKNTNSHQSFGFIAQELNEVFPEAVGSMEDPELMWGVDNSKLVPVLVKAIQEQQAIITQLQSDINLLKGTL